MKEKENWGKIGDRETDKEQKKVPALLLHFVLIQGVGRRAMRRSYRTQ
jgi:hypothetical protein